MPSALFIYLPIICAIVALTASVFMLRRTKTKTANRLYLGVAMAFAASLYFAVVFGLLAFVPGPGSAGPVQYAGEDQGAMALFRFRSTLITVALLGIPLVALVDLIALVEANRTERPSLKVVAALAVVLLLFGTLTVFFSAGSWFPTA
ncbi:MAG: hypothetical protein R3E76_14910 [Planctomycetota bacterium]